MKILLVLVASIFVSLASSAEADYAIYEVNAPNPMVIAEQMLYLCNEEVNSLPDVSCFMSIERWSMDLTLPVGNLFMSELEEIATLFCQLGEAVGHEPEITLNGRPRLCGGIEV